MRHRRTMPSGSSISGSKLVFMSENTPPSFAIRDNLKPFYDLTGIEVEILTDDLPVVQQKVGIDLRGGKADFQLNYVQDKPIGAPFADFFADLTQYTGDDTLPQDPDGIGRGRLVRELPDRLRRMYTRDRIVAFPYDCGGGLHLLSPGPVRAARKDFEAEYGYRMEFTKDTTWKNLIRIRRLLQEGARGRARTSPMAMPSTRAASPGRRSSTSSA